MRHRFDARRNDGGPRFRCEARPDHFDHGHDRGHPRGRGRGAGRFFDSNDLRLLILHLIDGQARHGYEIIKQIEQLAAGAHAPSPGMVYPTLTMLEEMGSAAVTVDGTRKLYAITDAGRQELTANRPAVDAALRRMQQAGERHVHERPDQIIRAIENLKLVLRMRAGQLSPEQTAAATDLIDNAARQIERL